MLCLCLNKTLRKNNVDVCWDEAMLSMLCLSQAYVMCRRRPDSPIPTSSNGRCWKESRQSESLRCACSEKQSRYSHLPRPKPFCSNIYESMCVCIDACYDWHYLKRLIEKLVM